MHGVKPSHGVYIHIAGIDLIRDSDGGFAVLEDNVRTPSGVSYVLENRMVMKKVFPWVFAEARVVGVEEYPLRLRQALDSVAPSTRRLVDRAPRKPTIAPLKTARTPITNVQNGSIFPAFLREMQTCRASRLGTHTNGTDIGQSFVLVPFLLCISTTVVQFFSVFSVCACRTCYPTDPDFGMHDSALPETKPAR